MLGCLLFEQGWGHEAKEYQGQTCQGQEEDKVAMPEGELIFNDTYKADAVTSWSVVGRPMARIQH